MGLAASGDASLVERVGWALAAQLRAAGLNWIHAPVLDVNTDPRNPEINTRAFSDDPAVVARYGLAILRGFQAHGLIATGKHFPGRGHSASDAHHGLPVIDLPLQDLLDLHIAPYRAMIAAGMPAIMTAHTIYPAFDRDEPATLSPAILTDYLRGELGFEGVVTSDNMTMGGIVVNYEVPDACIRALNAGVDLLLVRSESPLCEEIFVELLQAARDGRIPEDRLDEANARILRLKWDHGLFATGGMVDPALAADPEHDPAVLAVEREAAERATLVRNRGGLLPIGPDRRVLLVEQVHPTHELINNQGCHPSIFWEQLLEINAACMSVEIDGMSDVNRLRVLRRLDEADVVVMTNWVARRSDKDLTPFVREIVAAGKPVVVVTNSPFQFGSPDELDTVVNIFCTNPESLRAAAEIIYGRREAAGVLPVGRVR
jgi:beta-N-acetylhexosaminidase